MFIQLHVESLNQLALVRILKPKLSTWEQSTTNTFKIWKAKLSYIYNFRYLFNFFNHKC